MLIPIRIMRFENRSNSIQFNNKLVNALSKEYKINPEIIKLIITKGYKTKKQIVSFLNPQNFSYHNPFLLSGMKEAVAIIKNAVKTKKRITILGDYDTDGICSTAILYKYFESEGIKVNYFLPNRYTDGYGLTMDTVDKIEQLYKPQLLITVDCGISSYKEIEYAKSKGMEVVVTDHHEIPEITPDCVIIDPKLKQAYPFSELCGAGVALKVVQALKGYEYAKSLESIAALATVADIVPLKDENRAIVYNGLANYKETLPYGVIKLLEKLKLTDLHSSDIAFKLAPKINTAGRMGDANLAFRLFVEKNAKTVSQHINDLDQLNEQRVSDGVDIYDECIEMLSHKNVSELRAIVLHKDNWNGGVLGIVCARLVDKFNKPVCLISRVENEYKGSCRSVKGVDIYEQLSNLKDILIRFGGHNQAGGLSIEEKYLDEFSLRLNENIKNQYDDKYFEQTKSYDMDLNKVDISQQFVNDLERLEPYGFGNEKPIFKITLNNAKVASMKNYPNHLKIKFNNINLVAFNAAEYQSILQTNSTKEFLIEINTNNKRYYNNKNVVNGIVKAMSIGKLNTGLKKEIVNAHIIDTLKYINVAIKNNVVQINDDNVDMTVGHMLRSSSFGTLIVANNFDNYKNFLSRYEKYIVNYEVNDIISNTGENTILFCPNADIQVSNYSNVVFLEHILMEGWLKNFEIDNKFVINNPIDLSFIKNIETKREVFTKYHGAIINAVKRNLQASDRHGYYNSLVKLNPQYRLLKYEQFCFVIMVFSELGIINQYNSDKYYIKINKQIKSKLNNSSIYNYMNLLKNIK